MNEVSFEELGLQSLYHSRSDALREEKTRGVGEDRVPHATSVLQFEFARKERCKPSNRVQLRLQLDLLLSIRGQTHRYKPLIRRWHISLDHFVKSLQRPLSTPHFIAMNSQTQRCRVHMLDVQVLQLARQRVERKKRVCLDLHGDFAVQHVFSEHIKKRSHQLVHPLHIVHALV